MKTGAKTKNQRGRTIILVVALIASIGVGYAGYGRFSNAEAAPSPATRNQIVTVSRGQIAAAVSTTGSVVANQQAKLTFASGGRLNDVAVSVGDVVTKSQVLAHLDTTDLQLKVSQADSNLRSSQLKVDQLVAGATPSDLAAAKSAYDAAVAKLAQLQAPPAAADLAAAKGNYDSAVSKLTLLKAGPNANDVTVAKAALDKAHAALQQAQTAYDKVSWRGDIQARPESVALQQATDDYQSALATYNSKVAPPTPDQLQAAQAAVDTAKVLLDQKTQGPTPDQVTAAQAAVASAKATLDSKAGPTDTDLAVAKEQVTQSQLALQEAQLNLANATLTAPFSGVVAAINANVGEQVGAGSPVITILDPKDVRIDANVGESDVARLQVGQAAQLSIDALPNANLSGKVIAISGNATVQQGVVTYIVSIGLAQPNDGTLKSGMTVSANVVVAQVDNVLYVPNRAIHTAGRTKQVDLLVNGKTVPTTVQVGMANDQMTEITQGLQEGDQVVISATTTAAPRVNGVGGGLVGGGFGGPQGR